MHPAYSVIFFTTATGAGYGLISLLGVLICFGLVKPEFWLGIAIFGAALSLISSGLLSSTGHLGHPERAWRAFSQWRSSWLSREGVAAVVTFIPMGLLALSWIVFRRTDGWVDAIGIATALCAAATVFSTGMIYASLKPIAQWHSRFTVPGYFLYSITSGAVLLNAILQIFGHRSPEVIIAAIVFTALSWLWKVATWRYNDKVGMPASLNSATGLAGKIRSIEWPHTEENYLLKEMGYRIARKHQERLRGIAQIAAFGVPLVCLLGAFFLGSVWALALAVIAAGSQLFGLLVERWLFFAEAKHTVILYYGLSR
jgi:DMSO reductase anchor subunit